MNKLPNDEFKSKLPVVAGNVSQLLAKPNATAL